METLDNVQVGELAIATSGGWRRGYASDKVVEVVKVTATTVTVKLPPGGKWMDGTDEATYMKGSGNGRGTTMGHLVPFTMERAEDGMKEAMNRQNRATLATDLTDAEAAALAKLLREMRSQAVA